MKVAINGFGRIGRLTLRAFFESNRYDFEIAAVNDLLDINTAIHLLKYDSAHGKFKADIQKTSSSGFSINGRKILYTSEKSPNNLPWKELGVNLVFECTGIFNTKEKCNGHLSAGAKKVLISCPSDNADNTIVFGVNENSLNKRTDIIVSNASCTTNCLAPIIKTIHGEIGIINGFVTTIHSYTGDQRLVDMAHKELRRARAAANSIIPTSTGVTKAIEKIFPELHGKLSGLSIRVPTQNVSLIDFTFTTTKKTTVDEINNVIKKYSDGSLNGILGYTEEELVSCDFNHDARSAVVDLSLTKIIDTNIGHILAWYDNEWGFSNRMLDVAKIML